jgi:cob(I)alamin adenosyltransferase
VSTGEPREWTIGELAKATGVTVRTLRHYDAVSLLEPSRRSSGGHRVYGPAEVKRLYQILSLRALGFTLDSIAQLLNESQPSARALLRAHLSHVTQQLDVYQDLQKRLTDIVEAFGQLYEPSPHQLLEVLEVMNMTVRLTRIYTRAGDGGETHLGDRSRVSKTDPRIAAYGDVDELSSHLGVAIAEGNLSDPYVAWLREIQNDLYDVGADLAVPANDRQGKRRLRIGPEYIVRLEHLCDEVNAGLEPLNSFVLPGGTRGAAQLHVCRTVCRRAERHALRVADANPEVIRYLNRLSDLLFILGRGANDGRDELWQPGQHKAVAG